MIFLIVAFQLCVCLLLIKTLPHVLGRILFLYSIVSMLIHLCTIIFLVGGLEHLIFCHILGTSSSQLTFIFFNGVSIPPTRYILMVRYITPYLFFNSILMVPYINRTLYYSICVPSFLLVVPHYLLDVTVTARPYPTTPSRIDHTIADGFLSEN